MFLWHCASTTPILFLLLLLITGGSSSSSMTVVDIVTGATQGIGKAIAEYIAEQRSYHLGEKQSNKYELVLVGRNVSRGQAVRDTIRKTYYNKSLVVSFEECDVGDWESVQDLKTRIGTKKYGGGEDYVIGILVNNAAECPRNQSFVTRKQQQKQGGKDDVVQVDKQFATNVLGYHFMIKTFQDKFSGNMVNGTCDATAQIGNTQTKQKTHIVNIASTWAGDLDLTDINFIRRHYDNDSAYRQSKQCNRMMTHTWSSILQGDAVINACHPGDPCTTLSKDLGYNTYASPPDKDMIVTETPIPYLCGLLGKDVITTGGWFVGKTTQPSRCYFQKSSKEAKQLFELCESFCF